MNCLFSGDFHHISWRFCKYFKIPKDKKLNVLFVNYGFVENIGYNNIQKKALRKAFKINKIIDLYPEYTFSDKIDVIFINGGCDYNKLINNLVDTGHDKKIIELVKDGALFIGESLGTIIAGNYEYAYLFEGKSKEEMPEYNRRRKNFVGLKLINKVIIPHNSKYRFPMIFNTKEFDYKCPNTAGPIYMTDVCGKIIDVIEKDRVDYITLKENEALLIIDDEEKICEYNWDNLPVKSMPKTKDLCDTIKLTKQKTNTCKIVSFNIGMKIDNTAKILDFIKNENPEICVFQETTRALSQKVKPKYKSANDLISISEYSSFFAPIYEAKCVTINNEIVEDFGGKLQQGILTLSKFKIKQKQNLFYYNEYKKEYDATFFKEKDWCRSISNVILNNESKDLQIIGVHGIWTKDKLGKNDERIQKQTEFILSQVRNDIPCIVLGDFNLLPQSNSIKNLSKNLRNILQEYNIKTTRPPFDDGLEKESNFQICDYVFVNDKVIVKNLTCPENEISDHYPLIFEFEF